ncbi:heme NO-binding domain-containing protein [Fuerstiella marisgermanici]|uniref:Heme NO binding protein n=1 Tax=Fuerstiella marisgermanici TaxID=1891926 RepID=A0A1P8WFI6_9PLAN|nr:heme NO-binding domain-containing protein [Fuerstiella marisgermanici]APZ92838.1 Heme NO binding protein [Fuerstiella marisgermanici]
MNGIVFTALNEMVERTFGLEAWDALLQRTGQSGIFPTASSYPDDGIMELLTALAAQQRVPLPDVTRMFGEFLFTAFQKGDRAKMPEGDSVDEILMSVDEAILATVAKQFPTATLPRFNVDVRHTTRRMVMTMRSGA